MYVEKMSRPLHFVGCILWLAALEAKLATTMPAVECTYIIKINN